MDTKTEIWQGNELTRAKYSYTSIEINIMVLVIYKIQSYSDSNYYQLPITYREYIEKTQLDPANTFQIKKAVKSMMIKTFEIEDKEGSEYLFTLISGLKIDRKSQTIYINIDPFIMPYVRDIARNTTRYYLEVILSLKSKNAKRLYHYVAMWKSAGKFSMHFEDIKQKLFDEDRYEDMSSFIKKVIQPSIKEINTLSKISGLEVEYEFFSKYGQTKSITFYIRTVKEKAYNLYYDPQQLSIYEAMRKWNIADWFADNAIKTLPVEKIRELAIQTENNAKTNPGAYLRKLLIENNVPQKRVA
jgi:plasmid replication initiation protein